MNCTLSYHLKQRIYIACICGERHEAMRLEHELDQHLDTCPICGGLSYEPLAANLFKTTVFVREQNDNHKPHQ